MLAWRPMKCILCGGESDAFFKDTKSSYFACRTCDLHFLDPQWRLSPTDEHSRYRTHQNNPADPRYQEFMRPVLDQAREKPPEAGPILDFGCGEGSVFCHVLKPLGYTVANYDPFFFPDRSVLVKKYEFVAAVEVLEHLFDPAKELQLLRGLLQPGGRLGIMTLLLTPQVNFADWYYRRDPTHVCFYTPATFIWIGRHFGFSEVRIHSDRVIELRA